MEAREAKNPGAIRIPESLWLKNTGTTGRWLRRITDTLSGEPRDIEDLNEVLAQASERGIINADAFEMLEGVLRVVELQVRDIMVPRSQMVIVNRDDPPEEILPVVIESGHSRFPVIGEDRDQIVGILLAKDLLRYFAEGGRDELRHQGSACARSCSSRRASASTCCSRNSASATTTWRSSSTSTAACPAW